MKRKRQRYRSGNVRVPSRRSNGGSRPVSYGSVGAGSLRKRVSGSGLRIRNESQTAQNEKEVDLLHTHKF